MTKAEPARVRTEESTSKAEASHRRSVWQLQDAKAKFSEVFRLARTEGPQLITRQGKDGVIMLPVEQYERLVNRSRQPKSLMQFFQESPLVGLELEFERSKETSRDIKL